MKYLIVYPENNVWKSVMQGADINEEKPYTCMNETAARVNMFMEITRDGWIWAGSDHSLLAEATLFYKEPIVHQSQSREVLQNNPFIKKSK
jgi:hypothetical protein